MLPGTYSVAAVSRGISARHIALQSYFHLLRLLYGKMISLLALGVVVFLLFNLKVLPGAWHFRVLWGIYKQTTAPTVHSSKNDAKPLFKYLTTTTRAAPLECDYNGHKSNSTYFTDLDVNRTQLLCRLFKLVLSASHYDRSKRNKHLNIALGSTCCVFRKEIQPLQEVEIWSRVLSWDEKWVYVVSYFVRGKSGKRGGVPREEDILASAIGRYVLKDGRKTVQPIEALRDCSLLPLETDPDWKEYEAERVKGMQTGGLLAGLGGLPEVFCPDSGCLN